MHLRNVYRVHLLGISLLGVYLEWRQERFIVAFTPNLLWGKASDPPGLCARCLSAKRSKWQFSKRWDVSNSPRSQRQETYVTLVWDMKVQNPEIGVDVIL